MKKVSFKVGDVVRFKNAHEAIASFTFLIDSKPDGTGWCHLATRSGNRLMQNGRGALFQASLLEQANENCFAPTN